MFSSEDAFTRISFRRCPYYRAPSNGMTITAYCAGCDRNTGKLVLVLSMIGILCSNTALELNVSASEALLIIVFWCHTLQYLSTRSY